MESRGGVTGGATISDFLAFFAGQGYTGTFLVAQDGRIECATCHTQRPADEVKLDRVRRVEGVSDPDDMCVVAAMVCPRCEARGTLTACYGAGTTANDAEVLRRLDHSTRVGRAMAIEADRDDASLVRDTGWLPGPERG
jgi:hypothetical protein